MKIPFSGMYYQLIPGQCTSDTVQTNKTAFNKGFVIPVLKIII